MPAIQWCSGVSPFPYDPINFEECPLMLGTGNGKTQLTICAQL